MFSFKNINWLAIIISVVLTILVVTVMVNNKLVEADPDDKGKLKTRLFGPKKPKTPTV